MLFFYQNKRHRKVFNSNIDFYSLWVLWWHEHPNPRVGCPCHLKPHGYTYFVHNNAHASDHVRFGKPVARIVPFIPPVTVSPEEARCGGASADQAILDAIRN